MVARLRRPHDAGRSSGQALSVEVQTMKGVQFLVDDDGERKAVVIDLSLHGELWEDFFDAALARERRDEPRESLEDVRRKVLGH